MFDPAKKLDLYEWGGKKLAYHESGGDSAYLDGPDDDYPDYHKGPKLIEGGRYPARVTLIEETGTLIYWYFEIICGDVAREEVCGETNNGLSPEGEAREWAESILHRSVDEDEQIDLGDLEGKRCEITIRYYSTRDVPSVSGVYAASSVDPELEEIRMLAEVDQIVGEDPLGTSFARRLKLSQAAQ